MSTRTVRLDAESERALAEVQRATGMSVSDALKAGLVAVRDAIHEQATGDAWLVYRSLDLGPGGYAKAPARRAKKALPALLAPKRR
jgi:hypothetical protein